MARLCIRAGKRALEMIRDGAKLESSPYFNTAEFASPTFRDTRLNADRFNIKMEIEGIQVEPPEPPTKTKDENADEEE